MLSPQGDLKTRLGEMHRQSAHKQKCPGPSKKAGAWKLSIPGQPEELNCLIYGHEIGLAASAL